MAEALKAIARMEARESKKIPTESRSKPTNKQKTTVEKPTAAKSTTKTAPSKNNTPKSATSKTPSPPKSLPARVVPTKTSSIKPAFNYADIPGCTVRLENNIPESSQYSSSTNDRKSVDTGSMKRGRKKAIVVRDDEWSTSEESEAEEEVRIYH